MSINPYYSFDEEFIREWGQVESLEKLGKVLPEVTPVEIGVQPDGNLLQAKPVNEAGIHKLYKKQ